MKTLLPLCLALILVTADLIAQQSVSIGTTSTDKDAVLLLQGNGNQGLIIPKVYFVHVFGSIHYKYSY